MWCVYYTHHTIVFGWAKRAPNHCSKLEFQPFWSFFHFLDVHITLRIIPHLFSLKFPFRLFWNILLLFFLIHFSNFFLFHTLVFYIQPNNMKVILFFHFHSFKDAHELESRYDSSNASVLETKNGGRSKKRRKNQRDASNANKPTERYGPLGNLLLFVCF